MAPKRGNCAYDACEDRIENPEPHLEAIEHWDTQQLVGDPKNSATLIAPLIPRANVPSGSMMARGEQPRYSPPSTVFHTAVRFSSDLDIASNAAGDIVEIRSALVEIR
jgi:hypothetical protein